MQFPLKNPLSYLFGELPSQLGRRVGSFDERIVDGCANSSGAAAQAVGRLAAAFDRIVVDGLFERLAAMSGNLGRRLAGAGWRSSLVYVVATAVAIVIAGRLL